MSAQPILRRFINLDAERLNGWVKGIAAALEDTTRVLGLCGFLKSLCGNTRSVNAVQLRCWTELVEQELTGVESEGRPRRALSAPYAERIHKGSTDSAARALSGEAL